MYQYNKINPKLSQRKNFTERLSINTNQNIYNYPNTPLRYNTSTIDNDNYDNFLNNTLNIPRTPSRNNQFDNTKTLKYSQSNDNFFRNYQLTDNNILGTPKRNAYFNNYSTQIDEKEELLIEIRNLKKKKSTIN